MTLDELLTDTLAAKPLLGLSIVPSPSGGYMASARFCGQQGFTCMMDANPAEALRKALAGPPNSTTAQTRWAAAAPPAVAPPAPEPDIFG